MYLEINNMIYFYNTNYLTIILMGPLMISLEDFILNEREKKYLKNKAVGGIILFSRNFSSKKQVIKLIQSIRDINENILIAVDQEGGRVQRFQKDFYRIPPMAKLNDIYKNNKNISYQYAYYIGVVLAYELLELGIDFSFTPVLDVNYNKNTVIGDRAISNKHSIVIELAKKLVQGLNFAGMKSVGKHFPGHGYTCSDTHSDNAYDTRDIKEIIKDAKVFTDVNTDAIMTAHVIYPNIDNKPCTYSSIWLKEILRKKLNYDGIIFSDDLTMHAASFIKGIDKKAVYALKSGCNMLIICNNINLIDTVIKKSWQDDKKISTMKADFTKIKKINIEKYKNFLKDVG